MVVLKTRYGLENNPSGHNEHPERYSGKKERGKKKEKENSLYWHFLECEGGRTGGLRGENPAHGLWTCSNRDLTLSAIRNNTLPRDFKSAADVQN